MRGAGSGPGPIRGLGEARSDRDPAFTYSRGCPPHFREPESLNHTYTHRYIATPKKTLPKLVNPVSMLIP